MVGPPGTVIVDGSWGRCGRRVGCCVGWVPGGWLRGGLAGGAAVGVVVCSVVVVVGSVVVVVVAVVLEVVDVDVVPGAGPLLVPPPSSWVTP